MDWREDYKRKLGSPEDAAARVKSGDLVHTGLLPMPRLIADAIVARREELGHLDVTMVEPEYDPASWTTLSPTNSPSPSKST